MLAYALRFATSKMLIYFQKRFGGIARLTAIWVEISNILKTVAFSQNSLRPF
jgi:hypothetical protein